MTPETDEPIFDIQCCKPPDLNGDRRLVRFSLQTLPDGTTLLTGPVADQAALLEVLQQLHAWGVTVLNVRRLQATERREHGRIRQPLPDEAGLFRRIFDASDDPMSIRDRNGRLADMNAAYCAFHGYTREELLGTAPGPLADAEDRRRMAAYLSLIDRGDIYRAAVHQRHKDGTRLPADLLAIPFRWNGEPHLLTILHDRSEATQVTQLLREQVAGQAQALTALLEVARQVASTPDLAPLLRAILTQLRTVLEYSAAAVFLRESPDELTLTLYEGPIAPESLPTRWSLAPLRGQHTPLSTLIEEAPQAAPAAFGREVIFSGVPVIIPDVRADTALARIYRARLAALLGEANLGEIDYVGSWMGVPLLYRDEVIGMIAFDHSRPDYYTDRHRELALAFAHQAAIAIANAQLLADLQGSATLQERQRLARELHDAVTQQLFSASLIGEVLPQIWANTPDRAQEYLEDLRILTRGALAEMRALLAELRPAAITDTPLPDLVQHLAAAFTGRTRVAVDLAIAGHALLPPEVQLAFYRVAQEALQNIGKHARARTVRIELEVQTDAIRLVITDDGRGFDPERAAADHFGLAIMRERIEAAGGVLHIDSRPQAGARIEAQWRAA
ncbi:MAG TPA: PAS domain S-box protein [Chloroflexi bacterium]|nr:PAS domain S-box protein [Chloroflexota bacterium]